MTLLTVIEQIEMLEAENDRLRALLRSIDPALLPQTPYDTSPGVDRHWVVETYADGHTDLGILLRATQNLALCDAALRYHRPERVSLLGGFFMKEEAEALVIERSKVHAQEWAYVKQ